MEWSQLKPRERTSILLLGAAMFLGLYIRFVDRPVAQRVNVYKSQIRNSEIQLKDLETKVPQDALVSAKIKDLEAGQMELSEDIAAFEKKMPSQFNTSRLVGAVTDLAREVKLEYVKQRIAKEQTYSRIFLEIKFYSTYLDAIRYVAAIEAISPFMRVEEMEILEPVGKTIELGGAPVRVLVSCLLGDGSPTAAFEPEKAPELDLKRDILQSASKPAEALTDEKYALEGITFNAANPTAIVNGDVYQTGSKLGPYKVKQILSDSIVLTDGVDDHTLSLKPTEVLQ
jgi:Tfp pilus assembly protein PilO